LRNETYRHEAIAYFLIVFFSLICTIMHTLGVIGWWSATR